MFKIEGLSVPATVKVDEVQKKRKGEPSKLSGDDLQNLFSELGSNKRVKTGSDAIHGRSEKSTRKQAKAKDVPGTNQRTGNPAEASTHKKAKASKEPSKAASQPKKTNQTADSKPRPTPEIKSERKLQKQAPSNEPPAAPVVKSKKQLTPLQLKMQQKLSGSRFRWINEQLYTTPSKDAFKIFQEQPQVFKEYHDGFRHQVESWPENPVLSFVQQFKDRLQRPLNAPGGLPGDKKSGTVCIADMGCGEAELSLELSKFQHRKAKFEVHSFDMHAGNERITVADIAHVPLPDESCNVVVFSLALMGTNLVDFITEGIRILKPGGLVWIAEIKSRFNGYEPFIESLKQMGLYHKSTDESNKMFVKFEFAKLPHKMAQANEEAPELTLKPCIYKRR